MKVGFVFTNYNNSSYTRDVIYSLSINKNLKFFFIVIVDNNSELDDLNNLKQINQEFPFVKILFNNDNVGYFKGLNLGINYLKSNYNDINFILVGNNDLYFPLNFYETLKNKILLIEKYPVISPDLLTLDGIHQNPHVIKKISKLRNLIYDIYYFNYFISVLIDKIAYLTSRFTRRKDSDQFEIAQSISQGYGACYILGPIFFNNFDSLWAPTFLMSEEFFLSKQLEEIGFQIFYEPSIKVNHHDHATMGKLPNKKLWKISKESHKVYKKFLN